MPHSRRIALAAAILAVALPGVATAQTGAGDDQYQDPFAGESQPAPKAKPKPKSTPAKPVPQQQQQPSQQELSAQADPPATAAELPRTGVDLLPLTVAGVVLIAAGLLLRRRASHGRD